MKKDHHSSQLSAEIFKTFPIYEPAFANFKIKNSDKEFVIVGIHIQKDNVVNELNQLVSMYENLGQEFGTTNCIFTGDFNAEGCYLSNRRKKTVKLFNDTRFKSLIGCDLDTTVGKSDHAYDRIFVAGPLFDSVKEGDGSVYRFDEQLGLSLEDAFQISDHYPIDFEI